MKCLALDFGQLTGWAVRADDGSITSGTARSRLIGGRAEGCVSFASSSG